jgi:hypothetical protein
MATNRLQIVLHVCPSADFTFRFLLVVMAARISDVIDASGVTEILHWKFWNG